MNKPKLTERAQRLHDAQLKRQLQRIQHLNMAHKAKQRLARSHG